MKVSDMSTEKLTTASAVPVTMRLKQDVARRFKEYAQKDNLSQGDFLEKLLQSYGQPQPERPAEKPPISIFLCKKIFSPIKTEMLSEPSRTYSVEGKAEYWPPSMFGCPATDFSNQLRKEFGINNITILEKYNMQHVLNLLYDEKLKKYLVYEILMLVAIDPQDSDIKGDPYKIIPLTVQRCKHVSSFSEVRERFSTYANRSNLDAIEIAMSEQISPDEIDLFEQYF